MGAARIPGYALFELGIGEHAFWFVLGDSKKKEYKNEAVSGKILIQIRVEVWSECFCHTCPLTTGILAGARDP